MIVHEQLYGNYELIIASNGPCSEQKPRLDNANLSKYFSGFFISEEMGVNKPDSRFFEIILKKIKNKDKSSILMIGDDLTTDIQGAIDAGIDSCWFNSKNRENTLGINPTFTIKSFEEISKYLPMKKFDSMLKDRWRI